MDGNEREAFWEALCSVRDNSHENIQRLLSTVKMPRYLCRFRAVRESTLIQLQENKLYYSSADHYDDPFDTFVHVNLAGIKMLYELLRKNLDAGDPNLLNNLRLLEPVIGMNSEQLLKSLKEHSLDMASFSDQIKQVRTSIQKNLFSICFCEDVLNETLWLKYACNYRGFAMVYDVKDQNTFLCGKDEVCSNCRSLIEKPTIYPVYYSEKAYDTTRFALSCMLWNGNWNFPSQTFESINKLVMWDAERVSLIKKKCHEYDNEWRMIRPTMTQERTCIKMKPNKIVLGFRMPEYERMMVISAAKIAGISNIEELYIDDSDQLTTREFC